MQRFQDVRFAGGVAGADESASAIAERAAAQVSIQSFRPPQPQQAAPPTMAAGPSPVRG